MAVAAPIQLRRFASSNPATGEVLREFDCASAEDVNVAVERARAAQISWAKTPVAVRIRMLRSFQRALHSRKDEVAALISAEAGKPQVEALLTEVMVILDAAGFCMREAKRFMRPQKVAHGNPIMKAKKAYLTRIPYGVMAIVSPWNYPFSIPASEVMAALVTGNAVVLKPSEFTPLCALKLKELFDATGLPSDLFQVVIGDGQTGAALTQAKIDKIIFTGSVATGKRIAQSAAARLIPVVLELGGKDPMIVLEDTDLEVATSAAIWGAFMNAGQTCLSVERCYVHRSIFDPFVARCLEKAKALHIGPGSDPQTDVGPLISQQQLRIVESQLNDAVAQGAQVLLGGRRLPELGANFYTPTILTGIDHSMKLMREETFGPLLPIIPFENNDEAVQMANDSDFGLAAIVWTRDRKAGEAIAARLHAGTVMVNDVITCFGISEAPHGGVKQSGIGRTHGRQGLEEMVWSKYVDADLLHGIPKVWWYGYGGNFASQMGGFIDLLFSRNLGMRLRGGIKALGSFRRKGRL